MSNTNFQSHVSKNPFLTSTTFASFGIMEENEVEHIEMTKDRLPYPEASKRVNVTMTPQQVAQLEAAIAITGDNKAEAIRKALIAYCASVGVQFDPDVNPQGGLTYER